MSGGQVQRLALARAMLKSSPLLILDEPTSHLDPGLEADLQESSSRLTAGRTVLTIAHRLATVYQADRILVLQNGQLVAEGNHALLLATSPDYLELVRTYAGDPPDGGPMGTIPILPGSPNPDLGRVE